MPRYSILLTAWISTFLASGVCDTRPLHMRGGGLATPRVAGTPKNEIQGSTPHAHVNGAASCRSCGLEKHKAKDSPVEFGVRCSNTVLGESGRASCNIITFHVLVCPQRAVCRAHKAHGRGLPGERIDIFSAVLDESMQHLTQLDEEHSHLGSILWHIVICLHVQVHPSKICKIKAKHSSCHASNIYQRTNVMCVVCTTLCMSLCLVHVYFGYHHICLYVHGDTSKIRKKIQKLPKPCIHAYNYMCPVS
jgi:hypothetical protein